MDTTSVQSTLPSAPPAVLPVITEYIGGRPGYCGGEPHILGHRIKVRHVAVWHEEMGLSPSQMVIDYPTITLAQVHSALAYYYDHKEEIQAAIRAEDEFVQALKAKEEPTRFSEALKKLRASKAQNNSENTPIEQHRPATT